MGKIRCCNNIAYSWISPFPQFQGLQYIGRESVATNTIGQVIQCQTLLLLYSVAEWVFWVRGRERWFVAVTASHRLPQGIIWSSADGAHTVPGWRKLPPRLWHPSGSLSRPGSCKESVPLPCGGVQGAGSWRRWGRGERRCLRMSPSQTWRLDMNLEKPRRFLKGG